MFMKSVLPTVWGSNEIFGSSKSRKEFYVLQTDTVSSYESLQLFTFLHGVILQNTWIFWLRRVHCVLPGHIKSSVPQEASLWQKFRSVWCPCMKRGKVNCRVRTIFKLWAQTLFLRDHDHVEIPCYEQQNDHSAFHHLT